MASNCLWADCSAYCASVEELKDHLESHVAHHIQISDFKCRWADCDYFNGSKKTFNFKRHVTTTHSEFRPYQCCCTYAAKQKNELISHIHNCICKIGLGLWSPGFVQSLAVFFKANAAKFTSYRSQYGDASTLDGTTLLSRLSEDDWLQFGFDAKAVEKLRLWKRIYEKYQLTNQSVPLAGSLAVSFSPASTVTAASSSSAASSFSPSTASFSSPAPSTTSSSTLSALSPSSNYSSNSPLLVPSPTAGSGSAQASDGSFHYEPGSALSPSDPSTQQLLLGLLATALVSKPDETNTPDLYLLANETYLHTIESQIQTQQQSLQQHQQRIQQLVLQQQIEQQHQQQRALQQQQAALESQLLNQQLILQQHLSEFLQQQDQWLSLGMGDVAAPQSTAATSLAAPNLLFKSSGAPSSTTMAFYQASAPPSLPAAAPPLSFSFSSSSSSSSSSSASASLPAPPPPPSAPGAASMSSLSASLSAQSHVLGRLSASAPMASGAGPVPRGRSVSQQREERAKGAPYQPVNRLYAVIPTRAMPSAAPRKPVAVATAEAAGTKEAARSSSMEAKLKKSKREEARSIKPGEEHDEELQDEEAISAGSGAKKHQDSANDANDANEAKDASEDEEDEEDEDEITDNAIEDLVLAALLGDLSLSGKPKESGSEEDFAKKALLALTGELSKDKVLRERFVLLRKKLQEQSTRH